MFSSYMPSPVAFAPTVSPYDAYDARRSAIELHLLQERQEQRRQAEAAAIAARQREAERHMLLEELYRRHVLQEEEQRRRLAHEAEIQRQLHLRQIERQRQQIVEQEMQRRHHLHQAAYAHQQFHHRTPAPQSPPVGTFQDVLTALMSAVGPIHHHHEMRQAPEPHAAPEAVPAVAVHPTVAAAATTSAVESSTSTSGSHPSVNVVKAARLIQRKFRQHLRRQAALRSIAALAASLDEQQASFTMPSALDLQSSEDATVPKLAYTPNNKPLLVFEDFLVGMLSQLDEIASRGDPIIKSARKELVQRIEEALKTLDDAKVSAHVSARSSHNVTTEDHQTSFGGDQAQEEHGPEHDDSDDEDTVLLPLLDEVPSPHSLLESSSASLGSPDGQVADSSTSAPTNPPPPSDTALPIPDPSSEDRLSQPDAPQTALTQDRVNSLPSSVPEPSPKSSSSSSDTSSDAASDTTLAEVISEVLQAAHKLGEEVLALELQEGSPEKVTKSDEAVRREGEEDYVVL